MARSSRVEHDTLGNVHHAVSPALATVLNPVIGYEAAAAVAKESAATGVGVPEIVRRRRLLPESTILRIFSPSNLASVATASGRRGAAARRVKSRT